MTTKYTYHDEVIERESVAPMLPPCHLEHLQLVVFLRNMFSEEVSEKVMSSSVTSAKGKACILLEKASGDVMHFEADFHGVLECIDLLMVHR